MVRQLMLCFWMFSSSRSARINVSFTLWSRSQRCLNSLKLPFLSSLKNSVEVPEVCRIFLAVMCPTPGNKESAMV